jgi:hypothetical protein
MLDTILLIFVVAIIFYFIFIKEQKRERREMRKLIDEIKENNKKPDVTVIEKPVPYLIPFNRLYRWYYDPPYYYDPFYYYSSGRVNANIVRPHRRKNIYSKPKIRTKK